MNCRSKTVSDRWQSFPAPRAKKNWQPPNAFTLIEVVTALAILALISSSVLVVIGRCMAAETERQLRAEAFELARENMEKLLASASVTEMLEYGASDKNPDIQWQTVVEPFYEPVTSGIWLSAVCSATYYDNDGKEQTVELTHWLTGLSKQQMLQLAMAKQKQLAQDQNDVLPDQNQPDQEQPDQNQPDQKQPDQPEPPGPTEELICGYTVKELDSMSGEELFSILVECGLF